MRLDFSLGCVAVALLLLACDGGSNGTPSLPGPGLGGGTAVGTTSTDVAAGGTNTDDTSSEPSTGGTSPATSASSPATGGSPAAGGTTAASTTSSKPAAGGTQATSSSKAATGGATTNSTYVDNPTVCDDTATTKSEMSAQFSRTYITTTNNPKKSYVAVTNWWGIFKDQTVAVNGIGFKVNNPSGVGSTNNDPIGFPTIFIGTYQNNASDGSNLPKQLSTISSVPTVFDTNATSLDTSNFNATYDVWLTANNAPLAKDATNPGTGGAYVMVWLYDPAKRQPRGSVKASAQTVGKTSNTWDVWADSTNPPCISYVAKSPVSALTFDLLDFLKDSTKYGVKDSMYLSVVFAGFEIWNGGNGATINKFCAKVN